MKGQQDIARCLSGKTIARGCKQHALVADRPMAAGHGTAMRRLAVHGHDGLIG